jgi:7-cyano-7-deazaguanine synthase
MEQAGARGGGREAVILFSGGLDSTTVAAIARSRGFALHAISFRYGQRHQREIEAAARLAREMSFRSHRVVDLPLAAVGGSALTDPRREVPKGRGLAEMSGGSIPATYVPARNTIFLAHALAWCEVLGVRDIFIGVNALDYSGYPDCRPEFIEAFERLARLGTRAGVEDGAEIRIHAPLIDRTKAEIIRWGTELGLDYSKTWSCYDPQDGLACGQCDSCLLRKKGFQEAGIPDPTPYSANGR